jgi:hypothetical protein
MSLRLDEFGPFFNYMRKKVNEIECDKHLVQNYGQLIDLIGQMKSSRGKDREQICDDLEVWLDAIRIQNPRIVWWANLLNVVGGRAVRPSS